jgi:hypothetical protein
MFAPIFINTCKSHLGTVCRIFIDLSDMGWRKKNTPLYNLATHSMDKIVQAFDSETGQGYKVVQGQPNVQVVVDWPINSVLTHWNTQPAVRRAEPSMSLLLILAFCQ